MNLIISRWGSLESRHCANIWRERTGNEVKVAQMEAKNHIFVCAFLNCIHLKSVGTLGCQVGGCERRILVRTCRLVLENRDKPSVPAQSNTGSLVDFWNEG